MTIKEDDHRKNLKYRQFYILKIKKEAGSGLLVCLWVSFIAT